MEKTKNGEIIDVNNFGKIGDRPFIEFKNDFYFADRIDAVILDKDFISLRSADTRPITKVILSCGKKIIYKGDHKSDIVGLLSTVLKAEFEAKSND